MSNKFSASKRNTAAYWRNVPDWAVRGLGWRTAFYPKSWFRSAYDWTQETNKENTDAAE